jgi:release factor glutamine methyltransferase
VSLADLVATITERLVHAGVPSPEADAQLIVGHLLGISRGEVLARQHRGDEASSELQAAVNELVVRREKREPLQHLLGVAPFMSFEVVVGPGVFIPRPETESLATHAIEVATTLGVRDQGVTIVDLCAGSGVVAIALQREVSWANVTAVEASVEAFAYLEKNVAALAPEVSLRLETVAQAEGAFPPGGIDLVVSNPPYVPVGEIPNEPEVSDYDPPEALFGGVDGMDVVSQVISFAQRNLRSGGVLMMEHANVQGESVRNLMENAGFRLVQTEHDLLGRDRFTHGVWS